MTIAYSHNGKFLEAPTIWDSLSLPSLSGRNGYKFHIHVQRYTLIALPQTDTELAKWLETRWVAKGQYLESKKEEWASEPANKIDPAHQAMKMKI